MLISSLLLESSGLGPTALKLVQTGQVSEAMAIVAAALSSQPANANLWAALGGLYRLQGHWERSADAFTKSLRICPQNALAWTSLGAVYLTQGRIREGRQAILARWHIKQWPERMRYSKVALWDGMPERGLKILFWCEPDDGNVILLARYFPWLQAQGIDIGLHAHPRLRSFLHANWPGLIDDAQVNYFDAQCPLLDLPALWRGACALPLTPAVPYLRSILPARRASSQHGILVGMSFAHSDATLFGQFPLPELQTLRVEGASFIPLHQRGLDSGAATQDIPDERDYAQLAARIAGVDLVLTSDSTVAHLSGAIGKPTWLVVGIAPEPVWMLDRADSPWYPTLRIFRADANGWQRTIAHVAAELEHWLERAGARTGRNWQYRSEGAAFHCASTHPSRTPIEE